MAKADDIRRIETLKIFEPEKPKPQLSVRQLIQVLKTMPQNLPVLLEGCDCYGEAIGTTKLAPDSDNPDGQILITRNP